MQKNDRVALRHQTDNIQANRTGVLTDINGHVYEIEFTKKDYDGNITKNIIQIDVSLNPNLVFKVDELFFDNDTKTYYTAKPNTVVANLAAIEQIDQINEHDIIVELPKSIREFIMLDRIPDRVVFKLNNKIYRIIEHYWESL